ncbi:MAG: dihydrodipicolinate synthase family protein [Actinomycetia bacterium]|nr:dihydrodipicolinate synthase family protein [Actinomycetes bacterium]MCP4958565.1 dihydrodipicolinate synthase family protein [Actinomycetes bacterium]
MSVEVSKEFRGVIVAAAMPMTDAGEAIDEAAFLDHLDWLIDAGVHGLLVLSGTGEYAYLRPDEKKRVVEIALPHIDGRVPVMVQTSEMSLTDTIESSKFAVDHGADALMVLPPWLESPFERGVLYHYERVAQAVAADIALYNTPAASGVEITPAMFRQLVAIDNIKYMKDSQGDLSRIQKLAAICEGTNARVLCGVDPLAPYALMAGAVGMIWGCANIMPHECVELVEHLDAGRLAEALELWKLMWPINAFMWENELDVGFLPGVKAATEMVGRQMGPVRRPQMPVTGAARLAIEAGLSMLPVNGVQRSRLKWREWADEQDWLVRRTEAAGKPDATGRTS